MSETSDFLLELAQALHAAQVPSDVKESPMNEAVLPSWADGPVKQTLVDFVHRVTDEGGPDFVPPPERIATFDNDGTLWAERPVPFQVLFAQDQLDRLAERKPAIANEQPFKAFLGKDQKTIAGFGKREVFATAFATHAGMSEDEFAEAARRWFAVAEHPQLHRRFTDCAYRPQLELLAWLRAHGFKTFVVSGGGIDFLRAFAEEVYGIPPEQVIGSSVKTRFEIRGDHTELVKLAELGSFDDREVKPQNIQLHIGRRPLLAFGNSDGDLAMLRYTRSGDGPRLALLLHHDDGEREFAYDRDFKLSPLAEALDHADEYGITLVSMRRDWNDVFAGREGRRHH